MLEEKVKESVKTLEKALTILDIIKESDHPLGVNEISKLCPINLTTVFRILKTLKSGGWVYQDENDKYIVGQKISYVTEKTNFYLAFKEIAYYTMVRLTAQESQAMNLIVRENEKCYILQQSRTEKIIDYVPPKGTFLPIYASAGGKVLLAGLPEDIRHQILDIIELKPLTKHTITDRTALIEELKNVIEMGYAVDAHESQDGGFCVAVPVRGVDGEMIAALSFSGFIGQFTESEINYYYKLLKKASGDITDNLFKRS